ncbi:MAG: hypothetical protein ACLQJ7_17450 [Syntrophobacteraceae bacterium]
MMLPDFEKLFEPYTGHGASLGGTYKWMLGKAKQFGISEDVAKQVIVQTMLELANGKTFFHKCACCDSTDAHNTIEHYMRDKMIDLNNQANLIALKLLQDAHHKAILDHIKPHRFKRFWTWLWDPER